MPPLAHRLEHISVMDYLAGERESEVKHEYIEGRVYAMAGASLNHNRITRNLSALLWNALQGQPCEPLTNDMLVKTAAERFRYPDLMVVCNDDPSPDDSVRESPILLVEVLSAKTHRKDKTEKRAEYLALPGLLEYVLIEQDIAEVVVQRRSEGWRSSYYYPGQQLTLESIGLSLAVEAIYERVENEDMRVFLEQQQAERMGER
ncbi:MAG: Uma2 family endonuclease [Gammaproteobacteria bacterium]|nr:Uma2 family endonuclease [Gammaproteobacteria bacterium]MBU1655036.1 Uma2 family endonuclease [Gammaproteobacteria bacterium]MBU1961533.1 Uma2 family endonuclease [Gammaproteobacteria bacterium]